MEILSGQNLPSNTCLDRSLPPVTCFRNILNFLHRFGIRTTDVSPINLINGYDIDRYKLLYRLHETFDPRTLPHSELSPLSIEIGCSTNNDSGFVTSNDSSIPHPVKQAAVLAAELRGCEWGFPRPVLSKCLLFSKSIS